MTYPRPNLLGIKRPSGDGDHFTDVKNVTSEPWWHRSLRKWRKYFRRLDLDHSSSHTTETDFRYETLLYYKISHIEWTVATPTKSLEWPSVLEIYQPVLGKKPCKKLQNLGKCGRVVDLCLRGRSHGSANRRWRGETDLSYSCEVRTELRKLGPPCRFDKAAKLVYDFQTVCHTLWRFIIPAQETYWPLLKRLSTVKW